VKLESLEVDCERQSGNFHNYLPKIEIVDEKCKGNIDPVIHGEAD